MIQSAAAVRSTWFAGLWAATLILAAGCADEPTHPLEAVPVIPGEVPANAVLLTCTVDVRAGSMACEPSSPSGVDGGPRMNLIVGNQHHFVRLANDTPSVSGGVWSANVTVQNLTQQPMGTLDGTTPHAEGVRIFFVDEPSNGVTVMNHDGMAAFTGSDPQRYYQYAGGDLGEDEILASGETSGARPWQFALNEATEFQFSVLVSTTVPDPDAYGVHFTQVDVGTGHACALSDDGRVWCWGWNSIGQIGHGIETDSFRTVPTPVAAPPGVTFSRISTNGQHTCAEAVGGGIYCWGRNEDGQLGDGTTNDAYTPVQVLEPENVTLTNVATGTLITCADGSDGQVYCWGRNSNGSLGIGSLAYVVRPTPNPVTMPWSIRWGMPLTGLHSVAVGWRHACAHGEDGWTYCWGDNEEGQIGDWSTSNALVPTGIIGVSIDLVFSDYSLGALHTCAHASDDNLYCWGSNFYYQLGNGSRSNREIATLVKRPPGVTFSNVTAGNSHTCAEGSDLNIYCWGINSAGSIGDGTKEERPTAVAVKAPDGVTLSNPSAGGSVTCALGSDGLAYCWGSGSLGKLGDGTTTTRYTPGRIAGSRRP